MENGNENPMVPSSAPRLLPWASEGGNPCYVMAGAEGGYVSRLADDIGAEQLATGADVLSHARKILDDTMSPYTEVRYAGIRLAECLTDALRVAESRGLRLPARDAQDVRDAVGAVADKEDQDDVRRPHPDVAS